jgi:hypothetical protein
VALYVIGTFAIIAVILSVVGTIALAHAFNNPDELPEVYEEDEPRPFEITRARRNPGGNSHQRRLARRKLYRALKLRNA